MISPLLNNSAVSIKKHNIAIIMALRMPRRKYPMKIFSLLFFVNRNYITSTTVTIPGSISCRNHPTRFHHKVKGPLCTHEKLI